MGQINLRFDLADVVKIVAVLGALITGVITITRYADRIEHRIDRIEDRLGIGAPAPVPQK